MGSSFNSVLHALKNWWALVWFTSNPVPWSDLKVQSNLSYPNVDYPKLLGYSKTMDSPDFFPYYLLQ